MSFGPAPAWVVPAEPAEVHAAAATGVEAGDGKEEEDNGDGVAYLLVDDRVDVASATRYSRLVQRVTATHGLDGASRIEASFDPVYQHLVWHRIVVRRGGVETSRLDPKKIELSRRYSDLESSIYDGSFTAFLLLDDLRVGDVVDVEYSIVGFNPVFDGRLSELTYLGWGVPAGRVVREYRMPPGRKLTTRAWCGAGEPEIVESADGTIYRWRANDVAAADFDSGAPAGWDVRARAQVSEFASWADVVAWALPLYPDIEFSEDERKTIAEQVAPAGTDTIARAEALLRFVQEDVRYLSIAVGESSHRPSPPGQTITRRFGDCKDKAYLFCAMLRTIGIHAVPALVNTYRRGYLREFLPMPQAFNHVIVRIDLPEGGRCWVDATMTNQGGSLRSHVMPRYGVALPIEAGTTALEPIVEPSEVVDVTQVREHFSVPAFDGPADLDVTTIYSGRAAERMRSSLAETSRADLTKNFVRFYTSTYPETEVARPFQFQDEREANRLTLIEHYRVRNIFTKADGDSKFVAQFFPDAVRNAIGRPSKTMRHAPYAIAHPVRVEQDTVVTLPEAFPFGGVGGRVENKWFSAELKSLREPGGYHYVARYETHADEVAAEDTPAYARDVDRAERHLSVELSWSGETAAPAKRNAPPPEDVVEWAHVVAILPTIALSVAFFVMLAMRCGPPPLPREGGPTGIGGWIIVLLVMLGLATINALFSLFDDASKYFNREAWEAATATVAWGRPWMLKTARWLDFLTTLVVLANIAVFAVLVVRRHRAVKRVFIVGAIFGLVSDAAWGFACSLSGTVADNERGTDLASTALALVIGGLWITYFLYSRRVANTFRR